MPPVSLGWSDHESEGGGMTSRWGCHSLQHDLKMLQHPFESVFQPLLRSIAALHGNPPSFRLLYLSLSLHPSLTHSLPLSLSLLQSARPLVLSCSPFRSPLQGGGALHTRIHAHSHTVSLTHAHTPHSPLSLLLPRRYHRQLSSALSSSPSEHQANIILADQSARPAFVCRSRGAK